MTVGDLLALLLKLPSNAEIAVNGVGAKAREPEIVPAHRYAFDRNAFVNPSNAYLIRPAKEIV